MVLPQSGMHGHSDMTCQAVSRSTGVRKSQYIYIYIDEYIYMYINIYVYI